MAATNHNNRKIIVIKRKRAIRVLLMRRIVTRTVTGRKQATILAVPLLIGRFGKHPAGPQRESNT